MTWINPDWNAKAIPDSKLKGGWVCTAIFFTTKAQLIVSGWSFKYLVPIDGGGKRAHLIRCHPHRIERSDQPSHARAGDVINRDVIPLEPLEDSNMRKASCTAA